jgi:DNA polymerase-3 subunit delta'
MQLTWINSFADSWLAQSRQGRLPHAVLLQGPAGVGKRATAAWMAQQYLSANSLAALPEYPLQIPEHPDLHWVMIPEDKRTIGIDQIRELVANIRLTSYAGGGKVAVIEPANAMTVAAANSLLKTLEEPPGASLLILVAERPARLPATVLSRCQRLSIALPDAAESRSWLDKYKPAANWSAALPAAGNAPLGAIEALDRLPDIEQMAKDFAELGQQQATPLEVAARWTRHEPEMVLDWLSREVQNVIYWAFDGALRAAGPQPANFVLRRIDRRNLFCYLDIINRLRGQAAGSFNVQLTLESLLIDWADGLSDCRSGSISPLLGTG